MIFRFTLSRRRRLQRALTLILSAAMCWPSLKIISAEPPPVSTNWLVAQTLFQKAGGLLGEKRFQDAKTALVSGTTNLPAPYSAMSTQFVQQINEIIREPDLEKQVDAAAALCVSLQSHGAALKLKPPKNLNLPDDEEEDSISWSLVENGELKAALVRYQRKRNQERIPVYQEYYTKQIQMIQSWETNQSNPSFALELVRERYMKGYEGKADVFGALRHLHRVLPYAANSSNGVQLCQQFITCLSTLRDEAGRDAWENKLLADFKSDAEACAGVYYDRGIRAYHERRDFETSLNWMRKLCNELPNTKLWGDGQYSVGLILQDQKIRRSDCCFWRDLPKQGQRLPAGAGKLRGLQELPLQSRATHVGMLRVQERSGPRP